MRAKYCKCKNTYSIDCDKYSKKRKCSTDEYWRQGIGSIHKQPEE